MRLLVLLGILLLPDVAGAIELDYYTYNGFDETVAAFHRLALIISDNGFLVFVLIFAALGVTFAALKAGYDGFMGGQFNPTALFLPTILGVAVFKGLVLSTGTVHIYDPVRNAYEPVSDVPDFIVILSGLLSKIERGIVEVTDAAGATPYADAAGGITYSMIKAAMDTDLNDRYLKKSIIEYYNYCGTRALGQSTSGNWGQNLMHNSEDLYDDFANWTNAVLSVVYYPPGNDQGEVRSCTNAWKGISTRLTTAATYDPYIDSICRTVGMNPADAAQRTRCQALIAESSAVFNVSAPAMIPYLRSIILAKGVSDATNSADFSRGQRSLVDRQVMAEAFGVSEAMNSWVPRLRAYMTATVLGLIPMAFLFLVTPLFKNAIALMLGLFAWLALWGTCDAIAVQMAIDQAQDAFEQIRSQKLGVEAILQSPEAAVQGLGIFGKARLVALTLATALSAALFKFGGYAFAQLGQQWQGHLEQAGEAAGRQTLHPEAQAQMQRALVGASAPQAALASYGFSQVSYGEAGPAINQAAYGEQYVDASIRGGTPMTDAATTAAGRAYGGVLGENLAVTKFAGSEGDVLPTQTYLTAQDAGRRTGQSAESANLDKEGFGSTFERGRYDAAGGILGAVTTREKLEAHTRSSDIGANELTEVAKIDAAPSLVSQQFLTPDSAADYAARQLTFNFSQMRALGNMQSVSDAGTGAGRQQLISTGATNIMWHAVGREGLTDANVASIAGGVASARNIDSGSQAVGIDASSPQGMIDYLRQQLTGVSAFIPADQLGGWLRHYTDASDDQISLAEAHGTGAQVSVFHDPTNPGGHVQVGDLNMSTSLRTGRNFSDYEGGEHRAGVSRAMQSGALTIVDPTSLVGPKAVDTYKELFHFSAANPAGFLDDQTHVALGNAWAKVVEARAYNGTASDQEAFTSQVGLDLRLGKGGGGSRAGAGVRSVPPASSMGSAASAGGGAGVQHSEIGSVSENLMVSEMTRHVGQAFAASQKTAVKMFGDPSEWTPVQAERAQEVISSSFHFEMLNREQALTHEAREETKGPSFWQKEDLNREEADALAIRKVREAIDDVFH